MKTRKELETLAEEIGTAEWSLMEDVNPDESKSDVNGWERVIIHEEIIVTWSGVTGCGEQERIDGAVRGKFQRWVASKRRKYPKMRFTKAWAPAGTAHIYSGRRLSRARWCSGYADLDFYIEFWKKTA